jgi:hypothetical protein
MNDTKNIEKESITGDVISEKEYNKKLNVTEVANEEATIETKNTSQVIKSANPEKVIVKEIVEEPAPVVAPVVTKTVIKKPAVSKPVVKVIK